MQKNQRHSYKLIFVRYLSPQNSPLSSIFLPVTWLKLMLLPALSAFWLYFCMYFRYHEKEFKVEICFCYVFNPTRSGRDWTPRHFVPECIWNDFSDCLHSFVVYHMKDDRGLSCSFPETIKEFKSGKVSIEELFTRRWFSCAVWHEVFILPTLSEQSTTSQPCQSKKFTNTSNNTMRVFFTPR